MLGLIAWLLAALLFLEPRSNAWPGAAALYAGGPLTTAGPGALQNLRDSGFTTVIAWTLHVAADGSLSFNDQPLVTGGSFVGDPAWPERLAELKRGGTIHRLLFSVGSAGVSDFHHLRDLLRAEDAGNKLALNFKALKEAIPAADGLDLDDEDLLDRATTVAFSAMLGRLGYQITFGPYADRDFWIDCLADLEAQSPGLVTGFNLQCYAGGGGNRPRDWADAVARRMGPGFMTAGFVQPGLWCRHGETCAEGDSPASARAWFKARYEEGVPGGFIWLYDDLLRCGNDAELLKAYAQAVRATPLD